MNNVYAQINDENICIGVLSLCGQVYSPSLIEIATMDSSLIGKRYNEGAWEEVELPIEISDEDIIQSQILLNQQELLIAQKSQDEVLAAILLAQQTM